MDRQRYIDEHMNTLFAGRVFRTTGWSAVIFVALAALFYFGGRERISDVVPALITASIALLTLFLTGIRTHPDHAVVHRLVAYAAVSVSAAAVEIMILKSGNDAPSYAGMIVLGYCVAGFLTAAVSFHVVAALTIYGIYALPPLFIESLSDFRSSPAVHGLILLSLGSAVLMRHLMQQYIVGELGLRYDLDRRQALLEEDVKGQAAQLNATIVDMKAVIAARKKIELELRESEKKYRLVVEAAGEGILVVQKGIVKFANSSLLAITGYAQQEIVDRPFLDFVHPADWDLVTEQQDKRMNGELAPDLPYSFRVRTRDNAIRWVEIRWAMTSWEGVPATVSFIADVTERKLAADALRESEEKFRTLFEESRDVFYISTPAGRILDINPAGVELFGYASREEILAVDLPRDLYVNPRDRKRFIDEVAGTKYVKDYEVQLKRKNGEKLTVIMTGTAIRNEKGEMTALRGVIRNVTEQRKLEQQLLQSQKMEAVGQLAGGIAHDFNNILTAIVGYANLLQMKRSGDDPHGAYIEHILASAERASTLTRSLLAFSRKQVMNPRPVDLNEVIRKVEKLLIRLIGEDIEFDSRLAEGELIVFADGHQIEQVLMNLATNARDSMPRGGHLTVETRVLRGESPRDGKHFSLKPGDYAVLSVTDTGAGMDASTRGKIFEPFFTTKEVGKGTGLGLAMVYGIIKQHEGYIDVVSEVGEGTTFEIFLPMIDRQPSVPQPPRDTAAPPRGAETILLGEDDDTVRDMTTSMLVEYGYTVISAKDGEESVRKFREHRDRIGMLILDIVMPKKNGREVYEEIKGINPGIKVLFTSGYTADIIRTRGTMEEGLHFLPKPVAVTDLLKKIREILDE